MPRISSAMESRGTHAMNRILTTYCGAVLDGRLVGLFCSAGLAMPTFGAVTDIDYKEAGIKLPSAPHSLYESIDGDVRLQGGLMLYLFGAVTNDVNFGSDYSIDGAAPTQEGPDWWETVAQPALTGEMDIASRGTVFAGLQGSHAMTRGSRYGDAAGATPGHPEASRVDRAYLGWRSPGEEGVTLSFGHQKFIFGDGFLVGDGYADTGRYAAYYIGPSESFRNTAIASLDHRGWHGDLFHLEQDQYVSGTSDEQTRVNGANLDYTWGDRAKFGAAYLHTYASDIATREDMEVYNLRAKGMPLTGVPNLALAGQLVREENDDQGIDDTGWFLQATYTFREMPWRPEVLYRRAEFSENYDTLFYDFAGGWGNWFMGEIVGEYMLFNSNLDIDMIKASVQPHNALETGIIGYRFRYHDSQSAGATDRNFAREINLYTDWTINPRLSLSAIYAVAVPDDGADERFMDNDDTAQLFEIFASYRF